MSIQRYLLGVQYKGAVGGFTPGVTNALETAAKKFVCQTAEFISLKGTSRTDAGVHAFRNSCSIDLQRKAQHGLNTNLAPYSAQTVQSAINYYLDRDDILITDCCMVTPDFNAHASVVSRTYMYRIIVPKKSRKNERSIVTSALPSKRMFHRYSAYITFESYMIVEYII